MSWQRVRGHESVTRSFQKVVERGRLGQGYLFVGPEGIGKRLFAHELARALLCEKPGKQLEACGQCEGCQLVMAGTHPDFLTAARPEESLEIPINVIRELCRGFALKPARGARKVALLDDADQLNEQAGNCFLKTLEEPPPGSVLILIGSSADRLLPTLVSRCQVVRFAALPTSVIAEILEAQGMETKQASRLAQLSDGSLGQAHALADPVLWDFRRQLVQGLLQPRPDAVALGKELMKFVEEAGKESTQQRKRAGLVIRLLIEFLHDTLRLAVGGTPRPADDADRKLMTQLAGRIEPERLLELLERCMEGDMQIDRRVQLVLGVEALVDELCQRLAV